MTVNNGDTIAISSLGSIGAADDCIQSFHMQLVTGGPIDDGAAMLELADLWMDLWLVIRVLFHAYVEFTRLRGQDVVTLRLLPEQTYFEPRTGSGVGFRMPNQVTFPLSFKTIVPHVILRKLFGPPAEDMLTTLGRLAPAGETAMAAAAAFLLVDWPGDVGVWRYGYWSPKVLGFVAPDASMFTVIPGTLRRRRVGLGS